MLDDFVSDQIVSWLSKGGKLVDDATFEKRINACAGCPYKGKVMPVPGLKMDGCTICKCPLQSKARMLEIQRLPEKLGESLSAGELAKIKLGAETVSEKVNCPHPEADKWNF
jgi:hypothetical protein